MNELSSKRFGIVLSFLTAALAFGTAAFLQGFLNPKSASLLEAGLPFPPPIPLGITLEPQLWHMLALAGLSAIALIGLVLYAIPQLTKPLPSTLLPRIGTSLALAGSIVLSWLAVASWFTAYGGIINAQTEARLASNLFNELYLAATLRGEGQNYIEDYSRVARIAPEEIDLAAQGRRGAGSQTYSLQRAIVASSDPAVSRRLLASYLKMKRSSFPFDDFMTPGFTATVQKILGQPFSRTDEASEWIARQPQADWEPMPLYRFPLASENSR